MSDRASRFDAVDANGGARWEMRDGTHVVLTFGSHDRKYHLARYRPYTGQPREVLSGRWAGQLTPASDIRQWAVRTLICYECEALGRVAVEADGPRLSSNPDSCGQCIVCLGDSARLRMVTCRSTRGLAAQAPRPAPRENADAHLCPRSVSGFEHCRCTCDYDAREVGGFMTCDCE